MSFSIYYTGRSTGIWARPCCNLSVLAIDLFLSNKNISSNNKVLQGFNSYRVIFKDFHYYISLYIWMLIHNEWVFPSFINKIILFGIFFHNTLLSELKNIYESSKNLFSLKMSYSPSFSVFMVVIWNPKVLCNIETSLTLDSESNLIHGMRTMSLQSEALERWPRDTWWPSHLPRDPQ